MLSNWTDEFAILFRGGISLFDRPVLQKAAFSIAIFFFFSNETAAEVLVKSSLSSKYAYLSSPLHAEE